MNKDDIMIISKITSISGFFGVFVPVFSPKRCENAKK